MIVRWTKKNVRCRRNVDSYRMIRNEVMCQRNLECVLRQNAVYHRNLERCNEKCGYVSEYFGMRAKTGCSLSQEFKELYTNALSEELRGT